MKAPGANERRSMFIKACIFLAATVGALVSTAPAAEWQEKLKAELPLLGHRNWIIVADSAYPSQKGVETIYVGGDQSTAVGEVLKLLDGVKHVKPSVVFDHELKFLGDEDAPGVSKVRDALGALVQGRATTYTPHEVLLRDVDQAAERFRVIVLKTDETIPYTSVFLPLDCGYWSPAAQRRLERKMVEGGEGRPRRGGERP